MDKTPQEVIAEAEAKGEDLEVVPETFRPAAEANRDAQGLRQRIPVQPDDRIEGRFAASERLPGGYYNYDNVSMGTLPDLVPRNPNAPHIPLHPRASFDSFVSGTSTSAGNSVYLPRRVESIMGEEDRRKYLVAQANQREAGGAYMQEPRRNEIEVMDKEAYGYKNAVNESTESIDSAGSSYGYHTRSSSYNNSNNYSQPVSRAASPSNGPATTAPTSPTTEHHLAIPEPVHRAQSNSHHSRGLSAARSPLARLSLVRTAGSDGAEQEEHEMTPTATGTAQGTSSEEEDREGRSKERKKLAKKQNRQS